MEIDVFVSHHTSSSLHIVEGVVNKLENRGIRCWYAPRNTEGNYASSIVKAINSCKIFLLILNKPASESVHVLNEIDIVTKRLTRNEDVKILPFHVADEEIGEDAQYYLGRLHWIDAMTPPMYQRVNELVEHISSLLNVKETKSEDSGRKNLRLISKYSQPREIFEGRDHLLQEISEWFRDGNKVIFLEGIGGIGKSELAKQYARRYRDDYDTVLFVTYETSLLACICDDSNFQVENFEKRGQEESEREYFNRKLDALRQICGERTLLIIDNFDVDTDEDFSAFLNGNYKVIFTTRNAHPGQHSLMVTAIDDEKVLFDIFEKNYGAPVEEDEREDIRKIFRLIGYHTYTIELIAKQKEASFLTAGELLELLRKGNLSDGPKETVEGRRDKKTAFEHICSVFNTSLLSDGEKQIMRCLSIVSVEGMEARIFKKWADLPDFEMVNALIRRSWIRKSGQRLSLHPLVREVVVSLLKPDLENMNGFLNHAGSFCFDAWYISYEEKLSVINDIMGILKYFEGGKDRDLDVFEAMNSYLWQVGRFAESIASDQDLYRTIADKFGRDSMEAGFVARSVGGTYFNSGKLEESIPWYQEGLRAMLASGCEENEDLAMSYEKVARCYTWACDQDFQKAQEYFEKSLAMRYRLLEAMANGEKRPYVLAREYENSENLSKLRIAECYMEMGRMYQMMSMYEKALECTEKHYQLHLQYPDDKASLAYGLYDMGVSRYYLGLQYQEKEDEEKARQQLTAAEENLCEALQLNMATRGPIAIDTIDNQEMLGDVYAAQGKFLEASNAYMAVIDMTEKLLGADDKRIGAVKEKMNFA